MEFFLKMLGMEMLACLGVSLTIRLVFRQYYAEKERFLRRLTSISIPDSLYESDNISVQ